MSYFECNIVFLIINESLSRSHLKIFARDPIRGSDTNANASALSSGP